MILLSDGRQVVWALFYCDGYECETLLGIFDNETEAGSVLLRIDDLVKQFHIQVLKRPWKGSMELRSLFVGEYELPADATYILAHA